MSGQAFVVAESRGAEQQVPNATPAFLRRAWLCALAGLLGALLTVGGSPAQAQSTSMKDVVASIPAPAQYSPAVRYRLS
jgi:hypothetical protein